MIFGILGIQQNDAGAMVVHPPAWSPDVRRSGDVMNDTPLQVTPPMCFHCGEPIALERYLKNKNYVRFCSTSCSKLASSERQLPRIANIPVATVGAMSELIVATDLLSRGCMVFRALSPACTCDLVILHNGEAIRVEVRTGGLSTAGAIRVTFSEADAERSDVLAVVLAQEGVLYFPNPFGETVGIERLPASTRTRRGLSPTQSDQNGVSGGVNHADAHTTAQDATARQEGEG